MKTSTVEVGGILSPLSAAGVEKQLASLPGVRHVDVNPVAGSATVRYDESQTSLDAIRQRVIDCGYHCRGELRASHVCEPAGGETPNAVARVPEGRNGRADHSAPDAGARRVADSDSKPSPASARDPHAAHKASGGASADDKAEMVEDMGHAHGKSMEAMAKDMRNRFFIALLFSIPVFVYSPMGRVLGDFATPFGLDRKIFLFVVGSLAIV